MEDFDAMVAQYGDDLRRGPRSRDWESVLDVRKPSQSVEFMSGWLRKRPVTVNVSAWVAMTPWMARGYRLLERCRETVQSLMLPSTSPIPAQVDAALGRLCGLAETIREWHESVASAERSVEHAEAMRLVEMVAAVVKMAERREAVIENIDPESLRRTAEALAADLAAARTFLATDPVDRALAQAIPND